MLKQVLKPQPEGFSFNILCKYLQKIEETTKRIEKTEYLLKMMIRVDLEYQNDLIPLLLLLQNVISEPWEDRPSVLNVGEQLVRKAIQETFGVTATQLRADLIKAGDVGDLAQMYKSKQPKPFVQPQPLTLKTVHKQMQKIAETSGSSSQQTRLTIMQRMFQAGSALECRFLARMFQSKNRLGVQRKSLLSTLADYCCYKNLKKSNVIKGFKPSECMTIVEYINDVAQTVLGYQATNAKIDELMNLQQYNKKSNAKSENKTNNEDKQDLSFTDNEKQKENNASEDDLNDSEQSSFKDDNQSYITSDNLQSMEDLIKYLPNIQTTQFDPATQNPRLYTHALASYAFARCPSLVELLKNADDLHNVHWKLGVPILPMLARPAASYSEALEKADGKKCACEWKYDGFRAQIHVNHERTQIFSRSQEVMTQRFPEVTEWIQQWIQNKDKVINVVLDGEIVPVDKEGKILPFQLLSRRLRAITDENKSNISDYDAVFIAFDVIMLNSYSLMSERYEMRRKMLTLLLSDENTQNKSIKPVQLSHQYIISSVSELQEALDAAVANKTEGLIIKTLRSQYKPDRRSGQWIKLKKDYLDGVGDSFDLVPVAAWRGQGKRTGVFGAFLLASYNSEKEIFETVTQLGTGFSDEQLKRFTEFFNSEGRNSQFKPQNISVTSQYVSGNNKPDFWFLPEKSVVWEIKVADLSISKTHSCAAGKLAESGGVGARLPRLLREREDKDIFNCSTSQFVLERFLAQPGRGQGNIEGDEAAVIDEGSIGELQEYSELTNDEV